jgi:YD repeat-containing protein
MKRRATREVLEMSRAHEQFVYRFDPAGNLEYWNNDGRWSYTWDAENRLVRMLSLTNAPTNSWRALSFAYDWQGRRISKTVSNWNGAAWVKVTDQRFIYDGWNLAAILNASLSLLDSFAWGLDLSGSPQGAGGVGGLLAINDGIRVAKPA